MTDIRIDRPEETKTQTKKYYKSKYCFSLHLPKELEEKVDCKKKYNVEYVPTILYFSNHKLKDTLIGQQPYDKLEDFVKGKQQ